MNGKTRISQSVWCMIISFITPILAYVAMMEFQELFVDHVPPNQGAMVTGFLVLVAITIPCVLLFGVSAAVLISSGAFRQHGK